MKALIDKTGVLCAWFFKAANACQSPFLLIVRVYWGWQFWQAGWAHLQNMQKFTDFFISLGIPAPSLNAHFIAVLEAGGGILLVLGLGSRLISLLLAGDMLVAYITADREALSSVISDPDKFYAAAPYTLLFAALLILIFGPGMFSLDKLVARWFEKRQPAGA